MAKKRRRRGGSATDSADIPPERIELDYRELPDATKALLRDVQRSHLMVMEGEYLSGPVITAVFAGAWFAIVMLVFSRWRSITPAGMKMIPMFGILGSWPLIWAIWTFVYRATAPLKRFFFIHRAYIFDCHPDRIIAVPMCHVMDLEAMHVVTPFGIHKHSFIWVKLRSGYRLEMVSRGGIDIAKQRAQTILNHASEARALAKENKINEMEGIDLVDWRPKEPRLKKPPIFLASLGLSLAFAVAHYFLLH